MSSEARRREAREIAETIIGTTLVGYDPAREAPQPEDGDDLVVWADRLAWLVLQDSAEVVDPDTTKAVIERADGTVETVEVEWVLDENGIVVPDENGVMVQGHQLRFTPAATLRVGDKLRFSFPMERAFPMERE